MSNEYRFEKWRIREEMIEALEQYAQFGLPPGDFLFYVLSNDLVHAMGQADRDNLENIQAYGSYLYNEMPSQAWGSPERVKTWIKIKQDERRK